MDMTKKDEVDAAFHKAVDGRKIDVMVSNAAQTGPVDLVREVDPDKFLTTVDTNLRGSLLVAQAFLRYAVLDAVVIEVRSSAAHVAFGAGFAAYSIAKLPVFQCGTCWGSPIPICACIIHNQGSSKLR
jgi:NAD(P)-dependent dehydrogenase (short-subunit alcohol dehydrogenase family)